jgi:large subunit ribosomal protein L13
MILEETDMSTTLAKKETVERKWYVIDAAGKPLGRVAVQAATLLRGKHKPTFTPNVDCGDYVVIINAAKTELTGKKLEQKKYQHHTGWIGNLKEVKYSTLMNEKPAFAVELAVKGMLPKNSIGRAAMTRLKIYAGPEHKNAAQKPEPWTAI